MQLSCPILYEFLKPGQNLEKTNDQIPRKRQDSLMKDGGKDRKVSPILYEPSDYCYGSSNRL